MSPTSSGPENPYRTHRERRSGAGSPTCVDRLFISPSMVSLHIGRSIQLSAAAEINGVIHMDVGVEWGTADPARVVVSEDGEVTALACTRTEPAQIVAVRNGVAATVSVYIYADPR